MKSLFTKKIKELLAWLIEASIESETHFHRGKLLPQSEIYLTSICFWVKLTHFGTRME